ncbi:MAG: NADPH-dependent 7-cyano-7-deazaguanine reductase QueF [Bdellovibrionales bacterium]|nr:NADPH-dependent 7-cyano-7-deazaguanine reductase QueF [Bdellovibrionales bacterium]
MKKSSDSRTISISSQKDSGYRADGRQQIVEAKLLRFKNRTTHRRYLIDMTTPEFTCICPVSGFPDFATIQISYVPKDWCVELKSLKLYINKYRDQGIYHEDVTNKIMDDLVELMDPWEIKVTADFQVRGNIKTIISANHTHKKVGADRLVVKPL